MKKRLYTTRARADVQLNMTAMIDVIFILITFFMIICRSIGQENYKLEIPDECISAVVPDEPDMGALTVSVFPRSLSQSGGGAASADGPESKAEVLYAVRASLFDPQNPAYQQAPEMLVAQMSEQIVRQARLKGESLVHLRADRNLTYGEVQPVLQALARARIKTVQLAVRRQPSNNN
jgi:biopolymer transport protein ExbD